MNLLRRPQLLRTPRDLLLGGSSADSLRDSNRQPAAVSEPPGLGRTPHGPVSGSGSPAEWFV